MISIGYERWRMRSPCAPQAPKSVSNYCTCYLIHDGNNATPPRNECQSKTNENLSKYQLRAIALLRIRWIQTSHPIDFALCPFFPLNNLLRVVENKDSVNRHLNVKKNSESEVGRLIEAFFSNSMNAIVKMTAFTFCLGTN